MTYKLDDGTGTVEVKQWIDSEVPKYNELGDPIESKKEELKVGDWVRVLGVLKAFNGKRHVGTRILRVVKDMNEVQYHLLEATFVHLYFTRGPPEQFNAATDASQGQGQQQQQQQGNGYNSNGNGMGGGGSNQQQANVHLSISARRVMQCLKTTPQHNEGLHSQQIAAATGMPYADVMKAGDELLVQSLIFTTVDDNTWAILEM